MPKRGRPKGSKDGPRTEGAPPRGRPRTRLRPKSDSEDESVDRPSKKRKRTADTSRATLPIPARKIRGCFNFNFNSIRKYLAGMDVWLGWVSMLLCGRLSSLYMRATVPDGVTVLSKAARRWRRGDDIHSLDQSRENSWVAEAAAAALDMGSVDWRTLIDDFTGRRIDRLVSENADVGRNPVEANAECAAEAEEAEEGAVEGGEEVLTRLCFGAR
ncbi:hypothetical protein R3P38DRAFT_2778486 [Favolaschia claudopus]|uniref:Uncharacterized protein n=1 Tax=Favolaschia claudopus TaxID=2862362 RepID=A0AAW0BGZ2_9AGAR